MATQMQPPVPSEEGLEAQPADLKRTESGASAAETRFDSKESLTPSTCASETENGSASDASLAAAAAEIARLRAENEKLRQAVKATGEAQAQAEQPAAAPALPARPPGVFQKRPETDVAPPPGLSPPPQSSVQPPPGLFAPPGLPVPEAAASVYSPPAAEATPSPVDSDPQSGSEEEETTSVGSALHASGMCKPCGWFWKPGSCSNGSECRHCHLCPPGELLQRRKEKMATFKQQARLRMQAKAASRRTGGGTMRAPTCPPSYPMAAVPPPSMPLGIPPPPAMPGPVALSSAQPPTGVYEPYDRFWTADGSLQFGWDGWDATAATEAAPKWSFASDRDPVKLPEPMKLSPMLGMSSLVEEVVEEAYCA